MDLYISIPIVTASSLLSLTKRLCQFMPEVFINSLGAGAWHVPAKNCIAILEADPEPMLQAIYDVPCELLVGVCQLGMYNIPPGENGSTSVHVRS